MCKRKITYNKIYITWYRFSPVPLDPAQVDLRLRRILQGSEESPNIGVIHYICNVWLRIVNLQQYTLLRIFPPTQWVWSLPSLLYCI